MSRALFCPSFRGLEAAMSLPISEGPLLPKVPLQQACALAPATHLLATRPRPHPHPRRPCACSGPQQTAQGHFQLGTAGVVRRSCPFSTGFWSKAIL